MSSELIASCEEDMKKSLHHLDIEFKKLRAGKASTSILDGIKVDYYGSPTPLSQVATLSIPDARTIVISPFEKKILQDIEKAVQRADVGIQPNNDGNVIRLPIPVLTEERRKEIAKTVAKMGEDCKVAIRLVRQKYNDLIKSDKTLGEDMIKDLQKKVQLHTDKQIDITDKNVKSKQEEVRKI